MKTRNEIEAIIAGWLIDGSLTIEALRWHIRNMCGTDSVSGIPNRKLETFFDKLKRDRKVKK